MDITKKLIEAKKVKDMSVFKRHVTEIVILLTTVETEVGASDPSIINLEKDLFNQELLKKVHGTELTTEFGFYLFLKSKQLMMT